MESFISTTQWPEDVRILKEGDNLLFLIGTAHISQNSADLVRDVILAERPDCVCIELDEGRYTSLKESKRWESLNLKEIIKKKQLSTLIISLMLASYQKRLGQQLGVKPGTELLMAAQIAEENNIPFTLCDRDVKVTLKRAWKKTPFHKRFWLLASVFSSLFDKTEMTEDKLAEIRQQDVLNEMLQEMGKAMPQMKGVLIDERDLYLAEKIRQSPGHKKVAVVGAGHLNGIVKTLEQKNPVDLKALCEIPKGGPWVKIIGWGIPVIIVGSILAIGYNKGASTAGENAIFWILANGIPSALGALIALAHPLTIIGAFIAAPITSLTPLIGAGYVTAFIQAMLVPPRVHEFETISEDISVFKMWWKSRLLRVFLAFILPGLGSAAGTYIGGYEILSNLF
jgi:pheromone shutdown-related protein TraB